MYIGVIVMTVLVLQYFSCFLTGSKITYTRAGVNYLTHLYYFDVCEKTFTTVLYGFPYAYS
jgi:hypothetical protein